MSDQMPAQLPIQPLHGEKSPNSESLNNATLSKNSFASVWPVVVIVAVMLLIPLGLFLMVRNSSPADESSIENEARVIEPSQSVQPAPSSALDATSTPFPSPSRVPTPTRGPSPTPELTPGVGVTPTVGVVGTTGLSVEEIFLEDPQTGQKISSMVYAGQHVSLRARLRNSGSSDAKNIVTYWKLQGNLIGKNDHGFVKANSDAVYDDVNSLVYSGVVLKEGQLSIAYFADPENVLGESNAANNTLSKTITVESTRSDLEVSDIEFYNSSSGEKIITPVAGQSVLVKTVVKNLGQDKQVNYQLKWWVNDVEVKSVISNIWIGAGESKVSAEGYQMTLPVGVIKIRLDANIDSAIPETNSGNNSKTFQLTF